MSIRLIYSTFKNYVQIAQYFILSPLCSFRSVFLLLLLVFHLRWKVAQSWNQYHTQTSRNNKYSFFFFSSHLFIIRWRNKNRQEYWGEKMVRKRTPLVFEIWDCEKNNHIHSFSILTGQCPDFEYVCLKNGPQNIQTHTHTRREWCGKEQVSKNEMKCRCSLVNRKKTHGCDILCEKIKDQRNILVPLYCEIIGLRCSSVVGPLLFSPSTLYCIRWLFIRHSSMVPVEKKPNHRQNSHTLTHSLTRLLIRTMLYNVRCSHNNSVRCCFGSSVHALIWN